MWRWGTGQAQLLYSWFHWCNLQMKYVCIRPIMELTEEQKEDQLLEEAQKWWKYFVNTVIIKVKLSPKCNLGCFCEFTWVKPSCKIIITMKEALLRFTVFWFSGRTHFQWECYGHLYDSIKITIFKTLRRLDTTRNLACSITRVSTHEHKHWEHWLCT